MSVLKLKSCVVITSLLATAPLFASENREKLGEFTASVEFGYIMTSGNTSTTSFIVKTDVGFETESFRNQFEFDSLFKQDEISFTDDEGNERTKDVTSKEKYFASAQTNYKLNEKGDAVLAFGSYETDRFSGFHYQASLATGYNTRLLDSATGFLDFSIGPGYAFDSIRHNVNENNERLNGNNVVYDENGMPVMGDAEPRSQFILRGAATYQRKLMKGVNFRAAYSIEDGDYNTKSTFETSLTMQINGSLSLKASIRDKRNTNETSSNKNKRNTITLVYDF
ncbi:DUF481 domain-containing protein [Gayadomonas joobiniege]|uniref:DUF481 domain-containing protein n=1 Tax=Gayadomonas joobiniege TaxID=1234606 RepID=UPI00037EF41F|nr:DUF481 domain-containing protein [Gayadomonas joobiniege]